ncbi:ABC transporter substrate-binding protein [cyanobacterium endosymbiont of Epithemia clementina EcSB]|uniref:ABC transporter substrate-binding protein n=1 Tax=cyanobacterium endosymbiont of Epithemia clementina EcSB TaxID=3034674 RepID=UPI00248185D4|nr:ABC transporter substrate-binding protein [cyanobacterium endosymbiont of Epithemia clementina EcSB]WGT68471.1 ABC transporter substrate-binding protein [cyanobacterium endosymbiont of Epithemia clementina EcSB]
MISSLRKNFLKFPITLALALMLSSSLLVGCGKEQKQTINSSFSDGLKLGALLPVTGDLSSIGQNMPEAVKLAIDEINACGGVNDEPVTLITEDTQTDPTAGVSAMTKLAEVNKVAGVVGAFTSSVSSAAVTIAVKNNVMLVSPGSTSPVFTEQAKNGDFQGYWARTAPSDTYQARALAALANKKGFNTIGTVVINNDYGVGFEQEFISAFKRQGGKMTGKRRPIRYDPKSAVLDSEAAAAFANQPDAVATALYPETGSVLLQAAYKQGLTEGVIVLLTDGVYSEDFIKQVGQTTNGISILAGALGTVPGADGEALEAFTTKWKDKTGNKLTAFIPHSWDATILLMLAAEAADANTGEGIQSKIREVANAPGIEVTDPCEAMELIRSGKDINYQGASGNVDIDGNGDVVGIYNVWTVREDGTTEIIDKISPTDATED